MKLLTSYQGIKGQAGKLFVFALIMAVLITAFAPVADSVVYGESTTPPAITKYTVTFMDIDGKVLKVEEVDEHGDATPPTIVKKKGYKFLGWDNWYVDVTSDRNVKAVYELVMDTEDEEEGKLAKAETAEPPAPTSDKVAVATEGGMEVIDTSEQAITTPEIIKSNPTPTTVSDKPEPEPGLSPTTLVMIVVAAFVLIAAALFGFLYLRRKRKSQNA